MKMDGCAVPAGPDLDELVVMSTISRMLSDNYTLLIICAIASIIILFVLVYFVKQLFSTLSEYKKITKASGTAGNFGLSSTQPNDNEEPIDEDTPTTEDPNKYEPAQKRAFFKNLKDIYSEYNTEKANYIQVHHNRDNDDYVDDKVVYTKYDDYDYDDHKN